MISVHSNSRRIIAQTFVLLTAFLTAYAQPDLIISKISLTRDKTGIFVEKVRVTVTNQCINTLADASDVLVTFKEGDQAGAKQIYFAGEMITPLRGGESHMSIFDVLHKKIIFGRYLIVEADPYDKVVEAREDNNWRSMFPDGSTTTVLGKCK